MSEIRGMIRLCFFIGLVLVIGCGYKPTEPSHYSAGYSRGREYAKQHKYTMNMRICVYCQHNKCETFLQGLEAGGASVNKPRRKRNN